MIVEIAKGVYWVGVVDWAIRQFHGHELSTHRGTSYNAYLIVDDKIALVDTVRGRFREQFIENIRQVVDPAKLDYVVANHAEPDHSGSLPEVMKLATKATLIVSKRGRESVAAHHHQPWNFQAVQSGERISLGSNSLMFIEAPMLHWPDTMFTYLTGRNVLMSNDAFGQHYATEFRFNDLVDRDELYCEALKYYANILTPYSGPVVKKIDELLALKLPLEIIAPAHGIIWRKAPLQIVTKYQEWAAQKPAGSAVILYDTMYEATRLMAEAIGEGLLAEGVPHKILHTAVSDRSDVLVEVFEAKGIIIGSPTFNNGLLPTITPLLEDIRGLRFQNKIGAAFGSYGWSGESVRMIEDHLKQCKIPVVVPAVQVKWQPGTADLVRCREFGGAVARAIKAV